MLLVSNDDVKKTLGVDLEMELARDDDPSGKVTRFLDNVQDWCYTYLRVNYGMSEAIDDLVAWRKEYFKKGIIRQIEYILRNGKTSVDNGFIRETGLIVNFSRILLGYDAYNQFFLGAFCNIQTGSNPYNASNY